MTTLDLEPGDVYADRILIKGVLGLGSFARVYEVEVPEHPEPLALKLTREPVTSREQAQRALREIRILRALTTPHVVRTYDCGLRPDGHIYLLMDLLRGQTLDECHDASTPLPAADAVRVIHQACLGLVEAHAMGIVHRDVKPENVFIERSGRVKMLDFGLARSWDGSPVIGVNATDTHMIVGTPHYSQPEQLATRVLTPASDVYSLATILFELLSGRSPLFPDAPLRDTIEALRHEPKKWLSGHLHHEIPRVNTLPGCSQLPDSLVDAIARALSKEPSARPPSAGAFANILGVVLHRDFERSVAAQLRLLHPDGSTVDQLLLPGSHRIGSGQRCEIKLRDDSVLHEAAVLEWSGMPNLPHLRAPAGTSTGTIRINDEPMQGTVELGQNDEFCVGNTRLTVLLDS